MNKKILGFLAVSLSGFLVYLFDKIWGNSIDWDKVREVKIGKWIATEFALYEIISFLVIAFLIYLLGKKLFSQEKEFYTKKQRQLRLDNNETNPQTGILFRWGVFFNYETPFISDLTAFCTKHPGAAIRFINNSCPLRDCENHRTRIDVYQVKNMIESGLIDKWEKMK
jgi:large-conductance mechanosensitive channel